MLLVRKFSPRDIFFHHVVSHGKSVGAGPVSGGGGHKFNQTTGSLKMGLFKTFCCHFVYYKGYNIGPGGLYAQKEPLLTHSLFILS